MKWVFMVMLAVNAAFLTWQLSRDGEPSPAPRRIEPTTSTAMVNRLLLMSELERGVFRERLAGPPGEAPSAPPAPASPEAPMAAGTPMAPEAAEKLGDVLAAPALALAECYSVGPLEGAAVSELSAWFGAHGTQASLRMDERRELARTWVYLPPLASREAANAQVEEMRAADIDDIFVIPRGDMANAISLGLYSRRESLERRLAELAERGYSPSLLPKYRSVTASWFDVTSSLTQPFDGEAFAQRFPQVEIRPSVCGEPRIAGDQAIPYNSEVLPVDEGDSAATLGTASAPSDEQVSR